MALGGVAVHLDASRELDDRLRVRCFCDHDAGLAQIRNNLIRSPAHRGFNWRRHFDCEQHRIGQKLVLAKATDPLQPMATVLIHLIGLVLAEVQWLDGMRRLPIAHVHEGDLDMQALAANFGGLEVLAQVRAH